MASQGRNIREIDISIASTQSGKERYPPNDPEDAPRSLHYRNNLTGLTESRNYYFVAYGEEIFVFRPSFPTQKLGKRCFRWTPTPTGAAAYRVTERIPHGINQLLVSFLGDEEVISTAHDDGDYLVVTVRSIHYALEAVEKGNLDEVSAASKYIRYAHRSNVGDSAWGLATHKNARLLAVSSNNPKVTVYAPALTNVTGTTNGFRRVFDKEMSLSGHSTNIPAIAFCNTGADPEGKYLVSADIEGSILIWDIWKRCGIKKVTMSFSGLDCPDRFLGWSVTCIEPKVFLEVSDENELLGYDKESEACNHGANHLDVTRGRHHLRDHSVNHPLYNRMSSRMAFLQQDALDDMEDLDSSSSEESDAEEEDDLETTRPLPITNQSNDSIEAGENNGEVPEEDSEEDEDLDADDSDALPLSPLLDGEDNYDIVDLGPQVASSPYGPGPRFGNLARMPNLPEHVRRQELLMQTPLSRLPPRSPYNFRNTQSPSNSSPILNRTTRSSSRQTRQGSLPNQHETDVGQTNPHQIPENRTLTSPSDRRSRESYPTSAEILEPDHVDDEETDDSDEDDEDEDEDDEEGNNGNEDDNEYSEWLAQEGAQFYANVQGIRENQNGTSPANAHPPLRSVSSGDRSFSPTTSRKTSVSGWPSPQPQDEDPPIPFSILQTGEHVVTLLRPPFEAAAAICIDPCHQHVPHTWGAHPSYDRLSLTSFIPELNLMITATQIGRAAVFSLVRRKSGALKRKRLPFADNKRESITSSGKETCFQEMQAMRLDWVLPFQSQERDAERPPLPLIGIATSPVQGHGSGDNGMARRESRRWRLMLTYQDHTVLSYELWRGEKGSAAVEELVF